MKVRQYNEGKTVQWRSDSTMEVRQYNEGQAVQWRSDSTMNKMKMTEQTLIYKILLRKLTIEQHGKVKKYKETMNKVDNHCMLHCRLKALEEILDEVFFPSSLPPKCMHVFLSHKYTLSLLAMCFTTWQWNQFNFYFLLEYSLKNPEILGQHMYTFLS